MLFTSHIFLYAFLPLFLVAYYTVARSWRSPFIALASYVFYGWWRPDFVLLMLGSTVLDYSCGLRIGRARSQGRRGKRFLLLSLAANLGVLSWFKYAGFGVSTLNEAFLRLGLEPLPAMEIVLPVGISFYTFQTLSYTVDVYRGTSQPNRRFLDFACYVAMFPQLVAGPIVRYHTIADQLKQRRHGWAHFGQGVLFFQAGLAKKVLLADVLAPVADQAFSSTALLPLDAWAGAFAYGFQLYFDFSGYSDMAIGLGLMLGFRLPINFNAPYRADSITEFWRRWHISLSAFLRDYLYVPLGGNRGGSLMTARNLLLTMILGGLWHGPAWTFVAWGAFHGALLGLERWRGRRSLVAFAPKPVRCVITFCLVTLGWVIFRSQGVSRAAGYLADLFGRSLRDGGALEFRSAAMIAAVVGLLLIVKAPPTHRILPAARPWLVAALQFLFFWSLVHVHYEGHVPFLYFQF